MLKTDPLSWSTLDEATAWLTASTETPWTPRRVLDEVTRITANEVARSHAAAAAGAGVALKDYLPSNPYTPLFVAPPPSTEFILQPMPGVHPPGAAPDPMAIPWRMLPLRLDKARQLFASGAVVLLSAGWDEQSAEGRTLFGMELRPPVVATLADIRLHAGALLALLGIATDDEQAATAGPLNESTEPAPAGGANAAVDGPPPLTSPQIADAFNGIGDLSEQQWRARLGEPPKWLDVERTRASIGTAPKPSTWWPLELARILTKRGVAYECLNRKFVNERALKPWLPKWQAERRECNGLEQ